MRPVLSLFPGIGLLDMAFEEAGFCVVRGPDVLWGGDVKAFHPPAGVFAGVIGGPPCKPFSRLVHFVKHHGYEVAENLIPEYERVVSEAAPQWFVMENVPAAPCPSVEGYRVHCQLLNNRWCDQDAVQNRVRRISFGTPDGRPLHIQYAALQSAQWEPAACASGGVKPGIPTDRAPSGRFLGWKTKGAFETMVRLQGLPDGFLEDAPFTVSGKCQVVGNGVPLPMGRAIAEAVKRAMEES